ncbi:MAG: hypothetical protein NT062_11935 [Proteobacteria bacterium]|nr:hypothetical protein [Pseudomonadota bacterium]
MTTLTNSSPAHLAGIRWMIPFLAAIAVISVIVFMMLLYPHL